MGINRRIGVTGGTGVLGTLMINYFGIDQVSNFQGDIRNEIEIKDWISSNQFGAIFHFAAIVPVNDVEKNIKVAYDVNSFGTYKLLKVISEKKPKIWLFYASSSHVYKPNPGKISENHPLDPQNVYGRTKMIGDIIAQDFNKKYNIPVCIGRIFSFYHPLQGKGFLYTNLKEKLKNHNPQHSFELFNAESVRDISKAEEIVSLIYQLYIKKITGIVNIGKGEGIKICNFASMIAGYDLKILNRDTGNQNSLVADTSRLRKLLKR